MDYTLTNELQMLRKMYQEFVENEVKPLAGELDEEERFPTETIPKLAKYGFMGIPYETRYGGQGGNNMAYAMAIEELAKACGTTATIVAAHTSLCCNPIYDWGTEEQKMKYLPDLLAGRKIGAFGLTEPGAGSDASRQQTTAVLEGDHYVLNGSKCFITNASEADVFIVLAMTDPKAGNHGISAFIVERGFPGFSVGKHEKKMGIRGSATCDLIFTDCIVPKENLLGKEGKGFKVAMQTLDGGRVGVAAIALGLAEGAIAEAVKYTKERVQFNKRLSQFQNTQFQLADMQTKTDAAQMLVYRAAAAKDAHDPDLGLYSSMAKLFASENASDVTRRVVQLFGGYGYTREYPVERMMRDAKITEIYEGTSEVQRMVISSHMGVK
ncbi:MULTISPECIES: acyl-CoA dehydrogenase [Oscillospiraceae]|jgi:butyryl-CoA dehydrogenase|uniref:acyl-CoA dehydrogenase n=1 Tax=Oscillospiraceae TaxID=216572 RepID=UPI0003AE48F6|nr:MULTISPECIES: acyl-CoA dehydrogenase [unclassified Oscillibacter]ERK56533.1 butyryl-CoA dehydrogenase [Oscillibacter sp. KLE 1728]ERK66414.1 butyryl-CoA dehydrogenase [Oscillibacter sp. KLE 1745]